jgi:hypothetical protein
VTTAAVVSSDFVKLLGNGVRDVYDVLHYNATIFQMLLFLSRGEKGGCRLGSRQPQMPKSKLGLVASLSEAAGIEADPL